MAETLHRDPAQRRACIARPITLALCCIGLALALGWSLGARAQDFGEIPDADFKYLPKYCELRRLREFQQLKPFEKRVGCAEDLHHYCFGLWCLHTAALPNPTWSQTMEQTPDGLLGIAVKEFEYTFSGCEDPNAPLKPEILTNLGRAHIGLKQYENAVTALTEAIRRNPKYVAAYAELSGVFVLLNNREDARKILEDGLKQSPDSRFLKLRLERLGQKKKMASEQTAPEQKAPEQKATEPTAKQRKAPTP